MSLFVFPDNCTAVDPQTVTSVSISSPISDSVGWGVMWVSSGRAMMYVCSGESEARELAGHLILAVNKKVTFTYVGEE